MSGHR